jgi:hypothetical protein
VGDGRGTRELRASGASEGAPYGRTLPPERDGRWAEGAAYIAVWEQGRMRVVTWARWVGALLLRGRSLREGARRVRRMGAASGRPGNRLAA